MVDNVPVDSEKAINYYCNLTLFEVAKIQKKGNYFICFRKSLFETCRSIARYEKRKRVQLNLSVNRMIESHSISKEIRRRKIYYPAFVDASICFVPASTSHI